jgi:bifunctional non-homologous end joining protein LigD
MNAAIRKLLRKGKSSAMPKDIEPMLATLVDEIPTDEQNWVYEIKWDGYRALAYLNKGTVQIRSRNNKSFNEKFYPVYDALKKWSGRTPERINAVVDGEIVVVNDEGMPDFGDLQLWRSEADGQLVFYLFDVLWVEGSNIMNLPLKERHQLLQAIIPSGDNVIRSANNSLPQGKIFFLWLNN